LIEAPEYISILFKKSYCKKIDDLNLSKAKTSEHLALVEEIERSSIFAFLW